MTPMRVGEDGKPRPVEHILELQEGIKLATNKTTELDSDSD